MRLGRHGRLGAYVAVVSGFWLLLSGVAYGDAGHDGMSKGLAAQVKPSVTFTLRTTLTDGGFSFTATEGKLKGTRNPVLTVKQGDVVRIILINGDGVEHDLALPDFKVMTDHVRQPNQQSFVTFKADRPGRYAYYCTLPGHRQAGMQGWLVVQAG